MEDSAVPRDLKIQELVDAVADIEEHRLDDLPLGPSSPLGCEVQPNLLRVRSEAEVRRMASFGKAILEASGEQRIAIRNKKH